MASAKCENLAALECEQQLQMTMIVAVAAADQ